MPVDDDVSHFSDYQESNNTELKKAIKTLVNFISKGGDIDWVVSEDTDDDEAPKQIVDAMRALKSDFSEIRALKETLLLGHKNNE